MQRIQGRTLAILCGNLVVRCFITWSYYLYWVLHKLAIWHTTIAMKMTTRMMMTATVTSWLSSNSSSVQSSLSSLPSSSLNSLLPRHNTEWMKVNRKITKSPIFILFTFPSSCQSLFHQCRVTTSQAGLFIHFLFGTEARPPLCASHSAASVILWPRTRHHHVLGTGGCAQQQNRDGTF